MFKATGLLWLVLKRQWHYPGLTVLALLGIILTLGLLTSASFFSQAVDQALLGQELAYALLQEQLYHFAVLYAVGIRRQQIIGQVILEYIFLLAYGAAAGTFTGMLASELFVPFFRVAGEKGLPLPPLLPLVEWSAAWNLIISLALTIILVEVVLITLVLYQRLVALLKAHWR